jgi:hypothetical protein
VPPIGMLFLEFDANSLTNLRKQSPALSAILVSEHLISLRYRKVEWIAGTTTRGNNAKICLLMTTDASRITVAVTAGQVGSLGAIGSTGPSGPPGSVSSSGPTGPITPTTADPCSFTKKEAHDFATRNFGTTTTVCVLGNNYLGKIVGHYQENPTAPITGASSGIVVELFPASIITMQQKDPSIHALLVSYTTLISSISVVAYWDPAYLLGCNQQSNDLFLCQDPSTLSVSPTVLPAIIGIYTNTPQCNPSPSPKANLSHFPHKCPRCGYPAYVGIGPNSVDCSSSKCPCFRT